mgnify:CR=1 FL=1
MKTTIILALILISQTAAAHPGHGEPSGDDHGPMFWAGCVVAGHLVAFGIGYARRIADTEKE